MTEKLLTASIVVLLVGSVAQAEVYFQEDFENLTVGDDITDSTPTNYGSWIANAEGNTSIKVVEAPGGRDGKCVRIYDNTTSYATLMALWGADATETVTISYDMYLPVWSGNNRPTSYVGWRNPENGGFTKVLYQLGYIKDSNTEGYITNYETGASTNTKMTDALPASTWIQVEMTVPAMTGGIVTFHQKITAGDTVLFDGDVSSCWGGANALNTLWFTQPTDAGWNNVYLDNIKVVPEPATLALLAVGGAFGVWIRRK